MRIKLELLSQNQIIPINYQHFLSSAIYNYLANADLNFSTTLHSGINFKFFTFSWLQIQSREIINSSIKIKSPRIFWYISSPWQEFVQNLVNGLMETGMLRIGQFNFPINLAETLPHIFPDTTTIREAKFICLSPLVITTKKEYNGKLSKYYYKPTDSPEELSEKIRQNLINKYKTFYQREPQDTTLQIEFDKSYLKTPKAQILAHYIKDNLDIKIPAIMCPFTASGSPELIKFGYECGFGELNSAGFGMVKHI